MPRKGPAPRRTIPPDPVYHDVLVQRFINRLMVCGKKSVAEKVFYRAMEIVGERTKRNPLDVFHQALKNVMPVLEVRPRRVGGATYQVPMEVRAERRVSLGIRWLVTSARSRGGRNMID